MTIHEPLPDRAGRALLAADRLLRPIEFATVMIAGLVIFFVMWIGVAEIFSRKLFNYPLYGQLDIIELTMSSYALLPISYCWRAAGHIRVEIVIDLFAGRRRWLVELVTTVLALVLVTAIWPGVLHFFDNAYDIGDSTINTQWPTWPSKFVPIVGFSILWVRLVIETIAYVRLVARSGRDAGRNTRASRRNRRDRRAGRRDRRRASRQWRALRCSPFITA